MRLASLLLLLALCACGTSHSASDAGEPPPPREPTPPDEALCYLGRVDVWSIFAGNGFDFVTLAARGGSLGYDGPYCWDPAEMDACVAAFGEEASRLTGLGIVTRTGRTYRAYESRDEILALFGGSVTTRGQAAFLVWQAEYVIGCPGLSTATEVDGGFEVVGIRTESRTCDEDQLHYRIFVDPTGEITVPPEPEEVINVLTCVHEP